MALIKCPECGREVSPRAEACPHCGCPGKYFQGRIQTFGRWGEEDIKWRVLAMEDGRALLLSVKAIDCRKYHRRSTDVTWAQCDLRAWLNGEFLNGAFGDGERSRIAEARVVNDDNPGYGTSGGADTCDRVFCLSITEARRYFASDEDRICRPATKARGNGVWTSDSGACYWWLRSPGGNQYYAARVNYDGAVNVNGWYVDRGDYGVRPALWLNL